MKSVAAFWLVLWVGCLARRAPMAWQFVDMENTDWRPKVYTLNIVTSSQKFSAELPFAVEYCGRWA